jgi:hypothetical protein
MRCFEPTVGKLCVIDFNNEEKITMEADAIGIIMCPGCIGEKGMTMKRLLENVHHALENASYFNVKIPETQEIYRRIASE